MLAQRDPSYALSDLTRRSQARRFGPCAGEGAAQVASTCSDRHLAGSRPHALRPGFALAASHGRQINMRRRRYRNHEAKVL
jgi:hypothetical protein